MAETTPINTGVLTPEQILSADDIEVQEVEVPEWGGSVHVKALTGAERSAWEASLRKEMPEGRTKSDMGNYQAKLLVFALCRPNGDRLFKRSDETIRSLGRKSAGPLSRLFDIAAKLSGLGKRDLEEMKEAFEDDPFDSSSSSSPSSSESPTPTVSRSA